MLNTDLDEERNDNQRPPLPRPAIRQIVNCNEVCLTFVHFYDMQLCVVINCSFIYNKICKIVGFQSSQARDRNKKEKRLASCDYDGWDKYDVDTEISRIDLRDECERVKAKKLQEKRKADLKRSCKENIIQKCM